MASDDDVPHGEIDWATAAVRDGRLTVEITGEPGKAWSERVETIVERLDRPGSAWGETSVKEATVRVKDVREGAEADLRHLLESAVLQANAEFAADDEDSDDDDAGSEDDRAMTAAFRGSPAPATKPARRPPRPRTTTPAPERGPRSSAPRQTWAGGDGPALRRHRRGLPSSGAHGGARTGRRARPRRGVDRSRRAAGATGSAASSARSRRSSVPSC